GGGDDVLVGGSGSDILVGGTGGDTLVGGDGFDIAAFEGKLADYTITIGAGGEIIITGSDGAADTLTGIEVLDFTDVNLDTSDQTAGGVDFTVANAAGNEDTAIPLDIRTALADTDGSETLSSITIAGLPDGAVLSAGTHNADGTWTLTADQLTGLTVTPPRDYFGEMNLTVAATATEAVGGASVTSSASFTVSVADVPESVTPPTVTVDPATGNEDSTISLRITVEPADSNTTITIAGVPDGATLSVGTHNADGTWTLTADQLVGLTLTPADDSAADFSLTVTATAHGGDGSSATSDPTSLGVTVVAVADDPTLNVTVGDAIVVDDRGHGNDADQSDGSNPTGGSGGQGQGQGHEEGTFYPLNISTGLNDTDGSETLSGVTIAGLPGGARLQIGTDDPVVLQPNADGTYTLTAGQLAGLYLFVPEDVENDFSLTVSVTAIEAEGDTSTTSTVIAFGVDHDANPPTLTMSDASGTEDGGAIVLNIGAALTDTDGSEALSITIAGLPEGAVLSAGTHNADGSYTLTPAQLTGLTMTPPEDFGGEINLRVTATSTEV
ncbi:MAG: hypothetical protein AAB543_05080, partial [Pseudomonadota bacterium]